MSYTWQMVELKLPAACATWLCFAMVCLLVGLSAKLSDVLITRVILLSHCARIIARFLEAVGTGTSLDFGHDLGMDIHVEIFHTV